MDFGVRRIFELLQQHVAMGLGGDHLLGPLDRSAHAERAVGEDDFRAQQLQHFPALERHGLGHQQRHRVAARRADER